MALLEVIKDPDSLMADGDSDILGHEQNPNDDHEPELEGCKSDSETIQQPITEIESKKLFNKVNSFPSTREESVGGSGAGEILILHAENRVTIDISSCISPTKNCGRFGFG